MPEAHSGGSENGKLRPEDDEIEVDLSELEDPEHAPPKSEEELSSEVKQEIKLHRRLILRAAGLIGLTALASSIIGPSSSEPEGALNESLPNEPLGQDKSLMEKSREIGNKIEEEAKQIAHKVEKEGGSQREKVLKIINYAGVALFLWGLKDLMPKKEQPAHGEHPKSHEQHIDELAKKPSVRKKLLKAFFPHGNIHSTHYGSLGALLAAKYAASNAEEKKELTEEMHSNLKALGIIAGTITLAEGIHLDLEKAYEHLQKRKPEQKDRVALMTMTASTLSPLTTTVGSASILKNMAKEVSDGDKEIMASCQSHVGNLSGFLLFGDPPFIAVVDKLGFQEGVLWQLKTMWPLALYSLLSSTYKINKRLHLKALPEYFSKEEQKRARKEAEKAAYKDTMEGIRRNIPFLVKMMLKSLINAAKYCTGADFAKRLEQHHSGLNFDKIGHVMMDKISKMGRLLLFDDEREAQAQIEAMKQEKDDIIEIIAEGFPQENTPEVAVESNAGNLAAEIPTAQFMTDMAAEYKAQSEPQSGSPAQGPLAPDQPAAPDGSPKYDLWKMLHPKKIYQRAVNMERMKHQVGHNLVDVLNVFPFQASCVPFLTPVFKKAAESLNARNIPQAMKDMILFAAIMMFSSVADNYVACKVGLEIFPASKAHIPLIASIQGGSLSAIGNMANVALFGLDEYSFMDSVKKIGHHVDKVAAASILAQALTLITGAGILSAPESKKERAAKEVAANERAETLKSTKTPNEEIPNKSRRKFLGLG